MSILNNTGNFQCDLLHSECIFEAIDKKCSLLERFTNMHGSLWLQIDFSSRQISITEQAEMLT